MRRHPVARPRASTRLMPLFGPLEPRLLPSADVLTYHYDNMRSGWDTTETTLNPVNVNPAAFGEVFNMAVDGIVDAQPLYMSGLNIPGQGVHNVVFVATENDSVYAFDADSGTLLWKVSVLGPGETRASVGGNQPEGITATPVIDPTTGRLYVVAASLSPSTGAVHQRLHALSVTTGADVVPARNIDQSITYPGTGPAGNGTSVIFDPRFYHERDALLLSNGVVYVSWSSLYDTPPYTGWVMGFKASDLSVASILNVDPNGAPNATFLDDGSGNSFWNSGDGPAADAQGNLYNISANGPFDTTLNAAGFPSGGDYGDSILKMTPGAGSLIVSDYFTPAAQANDAINDFDLGSSGIALADEPGPNGTTLHLAVGSDKLGDIYVVNRDFMGKFNASGDAIVQELPGALVGGEFGAPVVYGGVVYFGAVGQPIRAYSFVNGLLVFGAQTSTTFSYPGATPSITTNGVNNGILWAVQQTPAGGVLHAYLASNPSVELYNSSMAAGGRDTIGPIDTFLTPVAANGRIYVATDNGVAVFGTLRTPPPIFSQPPRAAANPSVGNTVALSARATDASFPAASLTYFWGTLATPAGAAAPTFSDNGTNTAQSTVATVTTPGTYVFLVIVVDPSGTQTNCVDVVQVAAPAASAVPALAAAPAPAPAAAPGGGTASTAAASSSVAPSAPVSGLALAPATPAAVTSAAPPVATTPPPTSTVAGGRIAPVPQPIPMPAAPAAFHPLGERRPSTKPTAWWLG